jgi:hypothetical protein
MESLTSKTPIGRQSLAAPRLFQLTAFPACVGRGRKGPTGDPQDGRVVASAPVFDRRVLSQITKQVRRHTSSVNLFVTQQHPHCERGARRVARGNTTGNVAVSHAQIYRSSSKMFQKATAQSPERTSASSARCWRNSSSRRTSRSPEIQLRGVRKPTEELALQSGSSSGSTVKDQPRCSAMHWNVPSIISAKKLSTSPTM